MKTFKSCLESEILDAINNSEYITGVFKNLNCVDNTYNRNRLKEFMKLHNIPEDHFKKKITKEYYLEHPKYCKHCGQMLPFEKRNNDFCNHSCSASFNNKGTIRNPLGINGDNNELSHKIAVKNTHCIYCGKVLQKSASKFCCSECRSKYYYE